MQFQTLKTSQKELAQLTIENEQNKKEKLLLEQNFERLKKEKEEEIRITKEKYEEAILMYKRINNLSSKYLPNPSVQSLLETISENLNESKAIVMVDIVDMVEVHPILDTIVEEEEEGVTHLQMELQMLVPISMMTST